MVMNETIRKAQSEDFDVVFLLLEQLWADDKLDKNQYPVLNVSKHMFFMKDMDLQKRHIPLLMNC